MKLPRIKVSGGGGAVLINNTRTWVSNNMMSSSDTGLQPAVDSLQCLAGCALCAARPAIQQAACYRNVEYQFGPCDCTAGHFQPAPYAPYDDL